MLNHGCIVLTRIIHYMFHDLVSNENGPEIMNEPEFPDYMTQFVSWNLNECANPVWTKVRREGWCQQGRRDNNDENMTHGFTLEYSGSNTMNSII